MISIIVPVLNEEKNINRLQENLKKLQGDFEVIFCDGGSKDSTVQLVSPSFRVVEGRPGRGYQMNEAASVANGEVLFFIHCDAELESDVLQKIPESVKRGEAVGYLQIEFDSDKILMKICAFMSRLRSCVRKIIYGDQGVIIQKALYEKMGGIPELPLMEDLEFSLRLKKQQIPLKKVSSRIVTSSRRFEQNGMCRTMWKMQKMQVRYLFGENVDNLLKEYTDIR